MIDIGVARPSAQGQAMISTATALTTANVQDGSGPEQAPGDERRQRRSPSTASTNQKLTLSARRCIGARERWACGDQLHDLREHRVRPDLARRA